MIKDNNMICNVCMLSSKDDKYAVYVRVHKDGKPLDVCTSCMPSIIHGSGLVVKSDEEILSELGE